MQFKKRVNDQIDYLMCDDIKYKQFKDQIETIRQG